MILDKILNNCACEVIKGSLNIPISSICSDSRKVEAESLFIALAGYTVDGHQYIGNAIERGAKAIVFDDSNESIPQLSDKYEGVTFIKVKSSRLALGSIASNFYDNPSEKLSLIGITGTNGKTTTVTLLYNLFMSLGYNCGLLSTIANYVGKKSEVAINTTSDIITIYSLLAQMVEDGCQYCFMEVSSIGVEQDRIAGLKFKIGIFSNLTHDHLDYHKTFPEYLRCKKLFFDRLDKDAIAITNIDDKNGRVMIQNTSAKVVTYSCQNIADHSTKVIEESFDGMLLRIDGKEVWTRLIGLHNAYNLLAIYSAAVSLGIPEEEVLINLSNLESARGRLEILRGPRDLSVVIDYAHTPDALENVLTTLRNIAPERELMCLFGCGGDRDKTKRPEMAQVVQAHADRIIVTSDNSRTENPSAILEDIKAGMDNHGRSRSIFIENREEAIKAAIMLAKDGATILLAGKGHETYQIIGREKFHFDEKEIVEKIFQEN